MITDAMIEAGAIALQHSVDLNRHTPDRVNEAVADCYAAMVAARPTVDLGEDGELIRRLRAPAYWMSGSSDGHEGENYAPLEAADRLILYREARDELVKIIADAVEELKPFSPELDEADISEALYKRMTAVLSRSGG